MKMIPLTNAAAAFEPDTAAERIGMANENDLRARGISEASLQVFLRYRSGRDRTIGLTDDLPVA